MRSVSDSMGDGIRWDMKSWLWVLLCSAAIFFTIPLARGVQKFIYAAFGMEFFTYTVLFTIGVVFISILHLLVFRLKIRDVSRYAWLLLCGGAFGWFTIQLDKHPEEAVHLLEYGLLSFFVFRALNHRIRDRTVYISAGLIVLFVGLTDEFIQWMIPSRFWDYRDIGINGLAGAFFLLALNRVIRPDTVNEPVKRFSVKVLAVIITVVLTAFGLCLLNTPAAVNSYNSCIPGLSWLINEEPMTEYGHLHRNSDAGLFKSRLTLEELEKTDRDKGREYGHVIKQTMNSDKDIQELKDVYTRHEYPFMHEFLMHVTKRDKKYEKFSTESEHGEKIGTANKAYMENLILEEYFGNTLHHSGMGWPEAQVNDLQRTALSYEKDYVSEAGSLITSFNPKTAWMIIISSISLAWLCTGFWKTSDES